MFFAIGQIDGKFGPMSQDLGEFGSDSSAGGWTSQYLVPRLLADVAGDHRATIIGFASSGVYVATVHDLLVV